MLMQHDSNLRKRRPLSQLFSIWHICQDTYLPD
jgi:hypothetical protein